MTRDRYFLDRPRSDRICRHIKISKTYDEYFVAESAAKKGIEIVNTSASEDIVMLKHFAENPDLPKGL